MKILGIDPGSFQSGYVILDTGAQVIVERGVYYNKDIKNTLMAQADSPIKKIDVVVVEMIPPYGTPKAAGRDLNETLVWIGRFWEAWLAGTERPFVRIDRSTVRVQITRTPKSGDADVARALRERWGGDTKAVTGLKCPTCNGKSLVGKGKEKTPCDACREHPGWAIPRGPLYGLKSHEWQALAVAVAYAEGAKHYVATVVE